MMITDHVLIVMQDIIWIWITFVLSSLKIVQVLIHLVIVQVVFLDTWLKMVNVFNNNVIWIFVEHSLQIKLNVHHAHAELI